MKWRSLWRRKDWQHPVPESKYREHLEVAQQAQERARRRLRVISSQRGDVDRLVSTADRLRQNNNFGAMWAELFRSVHE